MTYLERLAEIVQRKRATFIRLARGWGIPAADAEDRVHGAIMRALKSSQQQSETDHFNEYQIEKYYNRALHSECMDFLRRRSRELPLDVEDPSNGGFDVASPEESVEVRLTNEDPWAKLEAVVSNEELIIIKAYCNGDLWKDVGLTVGLSPRHASRRLKKALAKASRLWTGGAR